MPLAPLAIGLLLGTALALALGSVLSTNGLIFAAALALLVLMSLASVDFVSRHWGG